MLLHAYLDESGTHNASELVVLAGYMSNEAEWSAYEKRTYELFKEFQVSTFHAVDIRNSQGDFKQWSINKKIQFLDEFQHIINEEIAYGLSAFILPADYSYFRSLTPTPTRTDTSYAILFRACMASALSIIEGQSRISKPQLNTTLESGHKNAGDVERSFNWICDAHPDSSEILVGLAFADKKASIRLAASDLLAYTLWCSETGRSPIGEAQHPLKSPDSYSGNIRRVFMNREALAELHAQALQLDMR